MSGKSLRVETAPASSRFRWSRKRTALLLLVLQNASVSILTRSSRTVKAGTPIYLPGVAVVVSEIVKGAISLTMLVREKQALERSKDGRGGVGRLVQRAVRELVTRQRTEIFKLAIPAALYAIQNTLLYTALSNLDAATYQTTYQLKLLTTALFSVLFFQRRLSRTKWTSLFVLTLGVAIVQLEGITTSSKASASRESGQDPRIGLAAILAACVSSGLAGGWFEYVLKSPATVLETPSSTPIKQLPPGRHSASPAVSPPLNAKSKPLQLRQNSPTLWERNLQLAVPSLLFSLLGLCTPAAITLVRNGGVFGLLQGFTPLVWGVVANQAMGGLLVAMVIREADGVAKGFATSIAIVVSTIASALIFGVIPGKAFLAGATLVILSTILYALDKE